MDRSHWMLVIACFIFYTIGWFLYDVQTSYESYILGREKERTHIMLLHPVIGMDIYKNYCIDNVLNVHEVKKVSGKFISKKVHIRKKEETPQ